MGILLDRLQAKKLLVSDGAWGTMLQAQGLPAGACTEEWNLSHPAAVQGVAAAYAAAGADLVLTNTFGGTRHKLAQRGLGDQTAAINTAGARLSLAGAPGAVVAASIGPTGALLDPYGDATEAELEAAFREQITALVAGGVRVLCFETMAVLEEAIIAITVAKSIDSTLDIICTMPFDNTPRGYRTMMGVDPARAAAELADAGADVIGANCGNGVDRMIEIATAFRAASALPILIHANAGMPELVDGKTVFRETPAYMAARVPALVAAGATIIGGCCGTTPAHIAALRVAVDQLRK